jgi:putative transposase
VPRDRAATFEPQIVKKRQRRLSGVDEVVLSLYAKGLTTGEISAHFAEIYGASVSKETISRITDKVIEEMSDWAVRPLDETYAAIFIDAIVVKVRNGQVANRPFYAAIGVALAGERDILGLWGGTGSEGAKFWMSVLTDLRNRGVKDVFFVVCDGLKGLPEVVGNVWPQTIVQTCIIHLIRNTFRLTSRKYWDELKRDIKPIYTAVNAAAARAAFDELADKRGQRYPAVIRLWDNAWNEFIPFLDYDVEIRRVICSTNSIESLNTCYRRAIKARGHFPSEQAAMKCLYLVTRSLDPTGVGRARWHQLAGSGQYSHALASAMGGPNRHRRLAAADLLGYLPGQVPRVKRLRRIGSESDRCCRHFVSLWGPGRAVVAGFGVGTQRRVGVGDLADHPDRRLS